MKNIIRNIFIILNPREKKWLWLLAVADVIINLLDIVFLLASLYLVHFYTRSSGPLLLNDYTRALQTVNPVVLMTGFFLLFTIKNAAAFIMSRIQYRFVYSVASRVSHRVITEYLDGSYVDFVNINSSVTNRKVSQTPIEFSHYLLNGVQQIFSQLVLILITVAALLMVNATLFPLLIAVLLPPVLLIIYLIKQNLATSTENAKQASEKTIQHLQEALTGFVESNVYQKKTFFVNRYHRYQLRLNKYLADRLVMQHLPPRLMEVFAIFGLLVLVWINSVLPQKNALALVTIGALMVAAYKIIPGIVKITNTLSQVKTYSYAAADLATFVPAISGIVAAVEPLHAVSFENVNFAYGDKKILSAFSCSIRQGDLAIVTGVSGKGKTTFVNLLMGFLQPTSGIIRINGTVSDSSVRKQSLLKIAFIKQEPFLIHGTLLENITLQENVYDKARMEKILAITGLDTLLHSMPDGLETMIKEDGNNFSGGQRQRIIIARALYKDADLLVMDEPFNELDEVSETGMLGALQAICLSGKMVVLITHNKAATVFGNNTILLEDAC